MNPASIGGLALLLGGFVLAAGIAVATSGPNDRIGLRIAAFAGVWFFLSPIVVIALVTLIR